MKRSLGKKLRYNKSMTAKIIDKAAIDAWEVIEEMGRIGFSVEVLYDSCNGNWSVGFLEGMLHEEVNYFGQSLTFPKAVKMAFDMFVKDTNGQGKG